MPTAIVRGRAIDYVRQPPARPRPGAPVIVFLHEGLGSVSLWRDFPQQVADATGCEAVVYSRHGYGRSAALDAPRTPGYMHDEALLALPEFLDGLGIECPLLCGHSDGGSIALIHAGGSGRPVAGVIAMAPHVMVENVTLTGIAAAGETWRDTDLAARLARHHADAARVFREWHDTWLSPAFRDWNIEEFVPPITAPILAIQGEDDEYATMEQIDRIARLGQNVACLKLADCGHSPQRDQPAAVIAAFAAFVSRLTGNT